MKQSIAHKIRLYATGALLAGLLCAFVSYAPAQTRAQRADNLQKLYEENMSVSLVPLPLFFSGFRVDYDIRLKDKLWLQLAPQYNHARKTAGRLDGFCLDINARWYVFNRDAKGFYVSGGLGVDYNQIGEKIYLPAEDPELPDVESWGMTKAFRFGGQILLGYQLRLWHKCFMDFYAGAAYRHSFSTYSSDDYAVRVESDKIMPWMYNFSGMYLQAGIRIGVGF